MQQQIRQILFNYFDSINFFYGGHQAQQVVS